MVVEVEAVGEDAVLDCYVDCRELVLLAFMARIDMAVHRHDLVEAP